MGRLACTKHKKRVLVLKTKTIHRSTGSTCDSETLKIGEQQYTPEKIRDQEPNYPE